MARKRKKQPRIILATILTILLLLIAGVMLFTTVRSLRTEREARNAGVQNYSRDIPRSVYGLEGFASENGRVTY